VLLFSASSVFGQLQTALDTIWRVPEAEKRKEQASGIWTFVRSRLLTFGMVLGLAFLVTVSLLLSTALSALGKWWAPFFGDGSSSPNVGHRGELRRADRCVRRHLQANAARAYPVARRLGRRPGDGAALRHRQVPDRLYLGKGDVGSSFGAFGSMVIVMVWIYYSAQIFLLGAEFTWAYAHESGSRRGEQPQKPISGGRNARASPASERSAAVAAPPARRTHRAAAGVRFAKRNHLRAPAQRHVRRDRRERFPRRSLAAILIANR
jgi:membrane protein